MTTKCSATDLTVASFPMKNDATNAVVETELLVFRHLGPKFLEGCCCWKEPSSSIVTSDAGTTTSLGDDATSLTIGATFDLTR